MCDRAQLMRWQQVALDELSVRHIRLPSTQQICQFRVGRHPFWQCGEYQRQIVKNITSYRRERIFRHCRAAIELPVTTTLMLGAIADVAGRHDEDLSTASRAR